MAKKDPHVGYIYTALLVVGAWSLIDLFLVLLVPSVRSIFAADAVEVAGVLTGTIVASIYFFLCAWGIKKHSKVGYYATWVALLLIILRLRFVGLVLAVFMAVWLVRSRKAILK